MRFLVLLFACLSFACASVTLPDGTELKSFSQGEATAVHPDTGLLFSAKSNGVSDNFATGILGRLFTAVQSVGERFFGGGGDTIINMPGDEPAPDSEE